MSSKEEIQKKITELESQMNASDFWQDKDKAQSIIKEIQDLKTEAEGGGKYDNSNAVITIFSGAGGDDAEDFSAMLFRMYQRYVENKGWVWKILHEHSNDHGGYRNLSFEVSGKKVYGTLKNESGVHRLVRLSPFNEKSKRHTSFSMVEVVPILPKLNDIEFTDDEIDVQFSTSSGPGGQNVNKRETAVRIVHTPTNLSVHVESERSQAQNKERALEVLKGKVFRKQEEDRKKEARGLSISKTVEVEWGNQIRSYVLHPYQMVKDHRTSAEVRDAEGVFNGDLDVFVDAEQDLE
ncbi:PCRF domain-containing protein [Candidatus Kaiserbacteria bacterium]|nr:PCRF domain-containing protein [Candidatus Kaiserbacteria bacterium]